MIPTVFQDPQGQPEACGCAGGAAPFALSEGVPRLGDTQVPQKKADRLPPAGAGPAAAGAKQTTAPAGAGTCHAAAPPREDTGAGVQAAEGGARSQRRTG